MTTSNKNTFESKFKAFALFTLLFSLLLAACTSSGNDSSTPLLPTPPSGLSLDEFIKSKNFSGVVLVRKDSEDVLLKAYGFADKSANLPNSTNTQFRIGSLTKPFTAMSIVKLKQVGLIGDYTDKATTYLPASRLDTQITIEHLLTHRSGIPDYLASNKIDSTRRYTPTELASLFDSDPLNFPPGSKYEYSNSNYIILGVLIEQLSGQSYFDYLQSTILNPLGLNETEYGLSAISGTNYAKGYTSSTQDVQADYLDMSIPYAAGALSSSLQDLQDWAESFDDLSLISEREYNEIFDHDDYGFGWGTSSLEDRKTYWHTGAINGFSSGIVMLPDDNGLIIILSNVEDTASNRTVQEIITRAVETEF